MAARMYCDRIAQTNFRSGLESLWPHYLSSVSWSTLKDRLLNWCPNWNVSVCLSTLATTVGLRVKNNSTFVLCKHKAVHVYLHIERGSWDLFPSGPSRCFCRKCQICIDIFKTIHLWSDHPETYVNARCKQGLSRFRNSKQETTSEGGMRSIERAVRSRTDGAGIKALRPSVRLPLCHPFWLVFSLLIQVF